MQTGEQPSAEPHSKTFSSKVQTWLDAFNNDQDVHSISTHRLFPEKWESAAILTPTVMVIKGKEKELPPCAYFTKDKKKCECPIHKKERQGRSHWLFGPFYLGDAPCGTILKFTVRAQWGHSIS